MEDRNKFFLRRSGLGNQKPAQLRVAVLFDHEDLLVRIDESLDFL